MVQNGYTSWPYWSNPPFLKIFDIWAQKRQSAQMSNNLKNGGLDLYGSEQFVRLILPQSEKCSNEKVK